MMIGIPPKKNFTGLTFVINPVKINILKKY